MGRATKGGREEWQVSVRLDPAIVSPCPWCGSSLNLVVRTVKDGEIKKIRVACLPCSVEGPWNTVEEKALEQWNQRIAA